MFVVPITFDSIVSIGSEYDLETYYNKYIDYDSFFEILSDYGFFGDEITDDDDDVEMKD